MAITISGSTVTLNDGSTITTGTNPQITHPFDRIGAIAVFFSSYRSYVQRGQSISGGYLWYATNAYAGWSTTLSGSVFSQGSDGSGGGITGDATYPRTVLTAGNNNPVYAFGQDLGNVAWRGPGGYVANPSGTWKALAGVPPSDSFYNGSSSTLHWYPRGFFVKVA